MKPKLVIFDVDGTLVDSQETIVAAMSRAFDSVGAVTPDRPKILSIVGLSLPEAMLELAPKAGAETRDRMVQAYKSAYVATRSVSATAPLYPGARNALNRLAERDPVLLGVATGKSRRGLDLLLNAHDLTSHFHTIQVSDHHPSKPHPSMLHSALSETGVDAQDAVMVGDTVFDMQMAINAGIKGLGVTWGYHTQSDLKGVAAKMISDFHALDAALSELLGVQL